MTTAPKIIAHLLESDADIPNNPHLPVLAYPGAVELSASDPAGVFERLFSANGWVGCWRNGIFPFHHFHSTAHEVLGIYSGSAEARLGGDNGVTLTLSPGDVLIIPAGVAHKRLSASAGLGVVGAYPSGQHADMCRPGERTLEEAIRRVDAVPMPDRDPVHGDDGPLHERWR